jgi:hypothetical protein
MSTLITYKIVSDQDGRLKSSAKLACDFWNRFVIAKSSIVIRLGVFTSLSATIARAYKPYSDRGVVYGRIEFNTRFLRSFTDFEIVGTIVHEMGHTLGFGWDRWMELFDHTNGTFFDEYVKRVPGLAEMLVETDYGPGTTLSHWDEEKHDKELMTGFKDAGEHVLPVTIDVMPLLDHEVNEKLSRKTMLDQIFEELKGVLFTRLDDARAIDRDHFEETDIWEEIYTERKPPIDPVG